MINDKTLKMQSYGPLKALVTGDLTQQKSKAVIFHGYGADAYDLYSLGRAFDPKGQRAWIFPNGPLAVPIGPGFTGRAWFPIDESAWEQALQEGHGIAYGSRMPPGMEEAIQKVLTFLVQIGFNPVTDYLGGFSQGSMMAIELVKHLSSAPKGVMVLSGALVDEPGFVGREGNFKNLKVFQSHGEQDSILPFEGAEALRFRLQKMGAKVSWQPFYGGHEIPMEVISRASQWFAN